MESRLFIYIESSDGAWSLILTDIILSETDLYLPWRFPHLPSAGRERDNSSFITTEFLLCSIRDLMSSSGGGSIVGSWVWQDDDEDLR